jgi:hypothetical protein
MPYLVNGQIVPEDLIRREVDRLGRDPHWQTISEVEERSRLLREAALQVPPRHSPRKTVFTSSVR